MTSRMIVVRGLGTALAFALGASGIAYAATTGTESATTSATSRTGSTLRGSTVPARLPAQPSTPSTSGGSTGSTTAAAGTATASQLEGVVYLSSTVASGTSAGTGIILSSDGTIVTNYHVVAGATTIEAQDATTGAEYDASIVGYDAQNDVAVLRLADATGLDPVTTDTDDDLAVGDAIVGVGDAGGDKGTASAASGTVTALDQSISVGSDSGSAGAAEQLTDMIEVAADIEAGDSGGPLYDADGEVVGIDTAASTGTQDVTGWAIPIDRALAVVDQVESGASSGTVVVGSPGFLGVSLGSTDQGQVLTVPGPGQQGSTGQGSAGQGAASAADVQGVVEGSAAADAGITAGSTITSFDGVSVDSADALAAAVAEHAAGDDVQVTWTDSTGTTRTATVQLGSAA